MSRTISLYSSAAIEPEDFLRFVADAGGEILDEKAIDGRVSCEDSHAWFYGVRAQLAGRFEEAAAEVTAKLGAPALARIDIHLSHHDGSGPLALEFAHRFARRWPAVATLAAYEILTAADVGSRLRSPRLMPILSPAVHILHASATETELAAHISALEGITIDARDPKMLDGARREVAAIAGARYDAGSDEILGFLPAGDSYVWVLRRPLALSPAGLDTDIDEKLILIAARHLAARPSRAIRVLIGYGASHEGERVALLFSERLLRTLPGVLFGIFELTLGVEDLNRMVESHRDVLLA